MHAVVIEPEAHQQGIDAQLALEDVWGNDDILKSNMEENKKLRD